MGLYDFDEANRPSPSIEHTKTYGDDFFKPKKRKIVPRYDCKTEAGYDSFSKKPRGPDEPPSLNIPLVITSILTKG